MDLVPVLPISEHGGLPPTALLLRWLERLHGDGRVAVAAAGLPYGNAALPALLRLGGISELRVDQQFDPPSFRWEGAGGGRLLVHSVEGDTTIAAGATATLPLHHGALPCAAWPAANEPAELHARLELARLEDASAVIGRGAGAAWEHLVDAVSTSTASFRRAPPLAGHVTTPGEHLGVWNPLPWARVCVTALPLGERRAPWGVADGEGARFPVQVVEGPLGREMLVGLELGALECRHLHEHAEPVPGAHWEVEPTVLDNGRVRAELDALGQIERLCCAGVFADLAGPLVAPTLDGLPLPGPASVRVLEDGPVRARIAVVRGEGRNVLNLVYTLHAGEDCLRVAASWSGRGALIVDHPTVHRGEPLLVAGELGAWPVAQAANAFGDGVACVPACRWAALGDGGRGLAVLFPRPTTVTCSAGHLRLPIGSSLSWALADAGRPSSCGRAALALATAGRPYDGVGDVPPALRWADLDGLVPLWVRRSGHGWTGEVILTEQRGRRGRAILYPRRGDLAAQAARIDAAGNVLSKLPTTPEGDGCVLDYLAHEVCCVRWR